MSHSFIWFLSLIAGRTLVVAAVLTVMLRIGGKREIGQLNLYDLALILALGNAVQNAMTCGAGDLSVGIVSAGMLLLFGAAFAWLVVRRPGLERRLIGSPSVIVSRGKLIRSHLVRERLTEADVEAALRRHGLNSLRDVKMVVLEVDGSLSVIPNAAPAELPQSNPTMPKIDQTKGRSKQP